MAGGERTRQLISDANLLMHPNEARIERNRTIQWQKTDERVDKDWRITCIWDFALNTRLGIVKSPSPSSLFKLIRALNKELICSLIFGTAGNGL